MKLFMILIFLIMNSTYADYMAKIPLEQNRYGNLPNGSIKFTNVTDETPVEPVCAYSANEQYIVSKSGYPDSAFSYEASLETIFLRLNPSDYDPSMSGYFNFDPAIVSFINNDPLLKDFRVSKGNYVSEDTDNIYYEVCRSQENFWPFSISVLPEVVRTTEYTDVCHVELDKPCIRYWIKTDDVNAYMSDNISPY